MPEHTLVSIFLSVDIFWVAVFLFFFICAAKKREPCISVLFKLLSFFVGGFVIYACVFANLIHTSHPDRAARYSKAFTPSQLQYVVDDILK